MRPFIVVFALVLSVAGCGESIRACAAACDRGGKPMASYSDASGCVCGEPAKEPAK